MFYNISGAVVLVGLILVLIYLCRLGYTKFRQVLSEGAMIFTHNDHGARNYIQAALPRRFRIITLYVLYELLARKPKGLISNHAQELIQEQ